MLSGHVKEPTAAQVWRAVLERYCAHVELDEFDPKPELPGGSSDGRDASTLLRPFRLRPGELWIRPARGGATMSIVTGAAQYFRDSEVSSEPAMAPWSGELFFDVSDGHILRVAVFQRSEVMDHPWAALHHIKWDQIKDILVVFDDRPPHL